MSVEPVLIKPLIDAVKTLLGTRARARLKRDAESTIAEALQKILSAQANEHEVEVALRIAEAAELLSPEVLLVKEMHTKIRRTKKTTGKKKMTTKKKTTKRKVAKKKKKKTKKKKTKKRSKVRRR